MRHFRINRNQQSSAFTLVELLVVIGIIAVLISILLPAMNRARQQAQMVDCASNMRQVGQALIMYAAESKGWLPPGVSAGWYGSYFPNETTALTWVDYLRNTKLLKPNRNSFTAPSLTWLNDYAVPVLLCPTRLDLIGEKNWLQMWSYTVPSFIFGVDDALIGGINYHLPRPSKLASLRPSPQVIMLAESFYGSPAYYPIWERPEGRANGSYGWDVRHMNQTRSNFLMADGHVEPHAFRGKITYGTAFCFANLWDKELANQLYYTRSQINLDPFW